MIDTNQIEQALVMQIKHHMNGWFLKVKNDFSQENFERELSALSSDPVYSGFHFDTSDYVNIRLMGRMSISIGRRLGEIYDKIPRMLAALRYKLAPEQVAPVLNGLEVDICLDYSTVTQIDSELIKLVCSQYGVPIGGENGIGIEIRYNFNPNDSSRLRKDEQMAQELRERGLIPIYLIFSTISPRDEAIDRLRRAGWFFIIGHQGSSFSTDLLGLDINAVLHRSGISAEIEKAVQAIMNEMKESYAFKQFCGRTP